MQPITFLIEDLSLFHSIAYEKKTFGLKALDAALYLIRTAVGYPELQPSSRTITLTNADQKTIHLFWRVVAGLIALTIGLPVTLTGMAIKCCLMDLQKRQLLEIYKEAQVDSSSSERTIPTEEPPSLIVKTASFSRLRSPLDAEERTPSSATPTEPISNPQVIKDRTTFLTSIDHDLFGIKPIVDLMESYLEELRYLVEINNYSAPDTGDFFHDRYLAIPKLAGSEYGVLQAVSDCQLRIQIASYINNPLAIIDLNVMPFQTGWTRILGVGALDPRNIGLTYAHIRLIKVLEQGKFRDPLLGERIDVDMLPHVD